MNLLRCVGVGATPIELWCRYGSHMVIMQYAVDADTGCLSLSGGEDIGEVVLDRLL
jgi:hypothetical protein